MKKQTYFMCNICGFSPDNRKDWCDLGCGSDYNEIYDLADMDKKIKAVRKRLIEIIRQEFVNETTIGQNTITVFDKIINKDKH